MNSVSPTAPEGKKEACKTYIEQTKLIVTLASAFLFAPAALVTILKDKASAGVGNPVLAWFVAIEALFFCSALSGYVVPGSLAGSQDDGSFDVFRGATRCFPLLQFGLYLGALAFLLPWRYTSSAGSRGKKIG